MSLWRADCCLRVTGKPGSIQSDGDAISVGDVGYLDADGNLFLTGRSDRMIVTSGKNVYPEEVEAVLSAYTGVQNTAVLGVDDRRRGKRLVGVLCLAEDVKPQRRNLMVWCKGKLPQYKIPMKLFSMSRLAPDRLRENRLPRSLHADGGGQLKRTAMSDAYIVSGRRTPVGVRGGWFAGTEIADLAAPVIQAVLSDADIPHTAVDAVIMGNALYGGGNPARVAALAADLPERVPALTVDSQCCAGLDAIALARSLIVSGEADVVVAGGVESYSRAPIRQRRPGSPAEQPVEYARPPFTPWPDRDPDMLKSAADLAARMKLTRQAQEAFAVESHRKARDDHRLPRRSCP